MQPRLIRQKDAPKYLGMSERKNEMLKIHIAQKDHQCFLCGKKIPKGHKYWRDYEEGGDDGALKDEKQHTNCELYRASSCTENG